MNIRFLFLAYIFIHLVHQSPALAQLYKADTKSVADVTQLVESLEPGDVLVLGELHNNGQHHLNQEAILNEMHAQGVTFDVGMEFFHDWRKQPAVDNYLSGETTEEEFLSAIGWGGDNYGFYRNLVLWPLEVGGWTYAINAPKELTRTIARGGLASLTPDLRALMPPDFQLGDAEYLERFKLAVGGDHVPPDQIANYFAAQSTWDETMAWQSLYFQSQSNSDVFVIIVGDFHVSYGGGLPDSLMARGAQRVVTVSQIDASQMNKEQKSQVIEPHPRWGQRADWIWLTE